MNTRTRHVRAVVEARGKRWARAAALVLLLGPFAVQGATEADRKEARPHYEKGATEYNLGHFVDAIAEFEKAYQLDRAPVLLFNIAQAHRQNGNNERAAFFYRRYLEQAPTAANRPEVEKRIRDLDEAMRQQTEIKRRPPTEVANDDREPPRAPQQVDTTAPPPGSSGAAADVGRSPPGSEGTVSTVTQPPPPERPDHRVRVMLSAGPAFPMFSGRDLDQGTWLLSVRAGGGYRFDVAPRMAVDAGLSLSYSPLQYRTTDAMNKEHTAGFWGVMATGTLRYRVAPAVDLHGEIGAGLVWWSGLGDANPFTTGGAGASGALAMPSFLIGLGASYNLGNGLFLFGEPAFLYSKTTGDGFASAVSAVMRFDLALGIGYAI